MNTSKHTFTSSKRALGGAAAAIVPALTLASNALADVHTVTEPAASVAPVVDPAVVQHGSTSAEPWFLFAATLGGLAVVLGLVALTLLLLGWMIAGWWRNRRTVRETTTVVSGHANRLAGDADIRGMLDNLQILRDAATRQLDHESVDVAMDARSLLTLVRQQLSTLPSGVLLAQGAFACTEVEAAGLDRQVRRALRTLGRDIAALRRQVQENPALDLLDELRTAAAQAADIRDMLRKRPTAIWA